MYIPHSSSIEIGGAEVPKGYDIVGAYDENGNLERGKDCTKAFVTGETKVVAFEVNEVGSPEPKLKAKIKVKGPHGKRATKKIVAKDIRKKTFHNKVTGKGQVKPKRNLLTARATSVEENQPGYGGGAHGVLVLAALIAAIFFAFMKSKD